PGEPRQDRLVHDPVLGRFPNPYPMDSCGCGPTTCPEPRSSRRLPEFDPVPFRVRDPGEPPVLRVLTPGIDLGTTRPEGVEQAVEVVHDVVDHEGGVR